MMANLKDRAWLKDLNKRIRKPKQTKWVYADKKEHAVKKSLGFKFELPEHLKKRHGSTKKTRVKRVKLTINEELERRAAKTPSTPILNKKLRAMDKIKAFSGVAKRVKRVKRVKKAKLTVNEELERRAAKRPRTPILHKKQNAIDKIRALNFA